MKAKRVSARVLFTLLICLISLPGTLTYAQDSGAPARVAVEPSPEKAGSPDGGLSGEKSSAGAKQAGETSSMKVTPLAWKDKEQQDRCEAYLPSLKAAYEQTIASVRRGDECAGVLHGKAFLDLAGKCGKQCPKGFLDSKGYSQRRIHEAYTYYMKGLKKCPGSEQKKPVQPDPR